MKQMLFMSLSLEKSLLSYFKGCHRKSRPILKFIFHRIEFQAVNRNKMAPTPNFMYTYFLDMHNLIKLISASTISRAVIRIQAARCFSVSSLNKGQDQTPYSKLIFIY